MTIRIAIVGLGKIAQDQHIPALRGNGAFTLAAAASPGASLPGVPCYDDLDALLASGTAFDAVALCTPPQARRQQAEAALQAGKHVLLEKPPGTTIAELAPLAELARRRRATLFAAWHSRFAPAVEPARTFLAARSIRSIKVSWQEDVRVWHPGQQWIWQPGGLGVFDLGINALSIVTHILPRPFFLTAATLSFPENRLAPIEADLAFSDAADLAGHALFNWRHTGEHRWDITVDTTDGPLALSAGGNRLTHGGQLLVDEPPAEYPRLYARFAELIAAGESDVDLTPLVHVADAFMLGRRIDVEAFDGGP